MKANESDERSQAMFTAIADRLRDSADELTDEWLDRLGERLGVRPRRLLPTKEMRDHIPLVLVGAADYLELPIDHPPNESVDILRTVAQLRREQGYDIQEVLVEVDVLADIVFDQAAQWVEEADGASPAEVMRAAARLSSVLRAIAAVAVGTYREEELRQEQELAGRLREFASMVSHEVANPLNTAGISAELLSRDDVAEDAEKRKKHALRIRDRLDRVHHLVEDLRALSIAEDARTEPEWVSVRTLVARVLEEVEDIAQRQGVEIELDGPEHDFEVDAVRVEIALMNLVSNAIKFADPEKDERWVRVSFAPAESKGLEGGRRITVEDNGRGIQQELQNKVFQRFFRGYPEVEGTGLGLEIAKRVVEQRGGHLWFESEPGRGTTFHMEIPQRLQTSEQDPGDVSPR